MKILYTSREAFERAKKFFNINQYEWYYEDEGNDNYLITVLY